MHPSLFHTQQSPHYYLGKFSSWVPTHVIENSHCCKASCRMLPLHNTWNKHTGWISEAGEHRPSFWGSSPPTVSAIWSSWFHTMQPGKLLLPRGPVISQAAGNWIQKLFQIQKSITSGRERHFSSVTLAWPVLQSQKSLPSLYWESLAKLEG